MDIPFLSFLKICSSDLINETTTKPGYLLSYVIDTFVNKLLSLVVKLLSFNFVGFLVVVTETILDKI